MSNLVELEKHFFKNLNEFLAIKNNDENFEILQRFLISAYEYCRHRHIAKAEDFSHVQKNELQEKIPQLFFKFQKGHLFFQLSMFLNEKDLFNYCKYRSAVQFLVDDFGEFIDDIGESGMLSFQEGFIPKEYYLTYNYSEDISNPYPTDPVPEHDGVPENHWWWQKVENCFRPK